MPSSRTITIYKFDELSDKAKEKARDWYREGALEYDWWDGVYEDAKNIGLKIASFDTDRGNSIEGDFKDDAESCAKAILKEHGKDCDSYKLADEYLETHKALRTQFDEACEADDDPVLIRKLDEGLVELDAEFKRAILEDYLDTLKKEVEYRMSDESVDESILANEYDFLGSGKRA